MPFSPKKFLVKSPAQMSGWMRELPVEELPVLARTTYELEDWREFEDQVDLQMLEDLIATDPLMMAKLFGYVAKRRGKDVDSEAETVRGALLLIGTSPFFKALSTNSAAEDFLAEQPEALSLFQEVLERSRRAARFAAAFAGQRDDADGAMLRDAALLYSLPELVLCLRAPALAVELRDKVAGTPGTDIETESKALLNVSLGELRFELMKVWRLPSLLAQMVTGQATMDNPQVRSVRLALKAAQQTNADWESAALAEVVREIGDFLQLGLQPTWSLLKNVERLDA